MRNKTGRCPLFSGHGHFSWPKISDKSGQLASFILKVGSEKALNFWLFGHSAHLPTFFSLIT
jgi:hypothetical protein